MPRKPETKAQKPVETAAVQEATDDLPPEIRALARKHSAAAIDVLARIVNGELDATPAAMVSAANALLEYGYGRPGQQASQTTQAGPSAAEMLAEHAKTIAEMQSFMPLGNGWADGGDT